MKTVFLRIVILVGISTSIARADIYELTDGSLQLVGVPQTLRTQYEDTFIEIGRANNLGYEELRLANPDIDPWLPGDGAEVILPKQFVLPQGERKGVLINLAEFRLYYFYQQDL